MSRKAARIDVSELGFNLANYGFFVLFCLSIL